MEDINRTISIQWVGPFKSLEELKEHKSKANNGFSLASHECFNFYYFWGNKKKCPKRKHYAYFGIHKNQDGIDKRVNASHEHLKDFNSDGLEIWIGALGNMNCHTNNLVEDVETLFISLYGKYLTENKKKKSKTIKDQRETICVINLWYDIEERPSKYKPESVSFIDDVIVVERDGRHPRYLSANKLKPIKP